MLLSAVLLWLLVLEIRLHFISLVLLAQPGRNMANLLVNLMNQTAKLNLVWQIYL